MLYFPLIESKTDQRRSGMTSLRIALLKVFVFVWSAIYMLLTMPSRDGDVLIPRPSVPIMIAAASTVTIALLQFERDPMRILWQGALFGLAVGIPFGLLVRSCLYIAHGR